MRPLRQGIRAGRPRSRYCLFLPLPTHGFIGPGAVFSHVSQSIAHLHVGEFPFDSLFDGEGRFRSRMYLGDGLLGPEIGTMPEISASASGKARMRFCRPDSVRLGRRLGAFGRREPREVLG